TMFAVSRQLKRKDVQGVEIIQLKGGMSHSDKSTNDIRTIGGFCSAFGAFARTLPLPVIFDSVETKRIVEQDRHIAHIVQPGREVDIALLTVGGIAPDSLALNLGQLSDGERDRLLERAVGDACSRFYRADGGVALPEVDARTVGITLADLRRVPPRVLVAGGSDKAEAREQAGWRCPRSTRGPWGLPWRTCGACPRGCWSPAVPTRPRRSRRRCAPAWPRMSSSTRPPRRGCWRSSALRGGGAAGALEVWRAAGGALGVWRAAGRPAGRPPPPPTPAPSMCRGHLPLPTSPPLFHPQAAERCPADRKMRLTTSFCPLDVFL